MTNSYLPIKHYVDKKPDFIVTRTNNYFFCHNLTNKILKEYKMKVTEYNLLQNLILSVFHHFKINFLKNNESEISMINKNPFKISVGYFLKKTNNECLRSNFYYKELDILNDYSLLLSSKSDIIDEIEFYYFFLYRRHQIKVLEFTITIVYMDKKHNYFITSDGFSFFLHY